MAINRPEVEALLHQHGYTDFRWIDPKQIVVSQWVRMKCTFGCGEYGRSAACPPNVPSVAECRAFFDEYSAAVILHFEKAVERPEDRHAWTKQVNQGLSQLERAVFLAGHERTFLLFMDTCGLCTDCPGRRAECKHPRLARPAPEAMAVDVYSTVRAAGYHVQVLSDYAQAMNRFAFLLIE